MKLKLAILIFCWMLASGIQAQPFAAEMAAFKKQDSIAMPGTSQVLFIGSSSFTYWKDVQDYFPAIPILNRAFGGSTLHDLLYYKNYLITTYHPKKIVIYCGENDFAQSDTVSVSLVVNRFKELFTYIRQVNSRMPVVYVSIKPSPSRKNLMSKFEQANLQISEWMATQRRAKFVDVYHSMLQPDGLPLPEIFTADSLHMNAKGYAIWQQHLNNALRKK